MPSRGSTSPFLRSSASYCGNAAALTLAPKLQSRSLPPPFDRTSDCEPWVVGDRWYSRSLAEAATSGATRPEPEMASTSNWVSGSLLLMVRVAGYDWAAPGVKLTLTRADPSGGMMKLVWSGE